MQQTNKKIKLLCVLSCSHKGKKNQPYTFDSVQVMDTTKYHMADLGFTFLKKKKKGTCKLNVTTKTGCKT